VEFIVEAVPYERVVYLSDTAVKENVRRTRGVELDRKYQIIKLYLRCVAQIDVQEIMDERPHNETSQMKTVFSL
jgi:hypothetical protein